MASIEKLRQKWDKKVKRSDDLRKKVDKVLDTYTAALGETADAAIALGVAQAAQQATTAANSPTAVRVARTRKPKDAVPTPAVE